MKRIRIPWLVDLVIAEDADEIESLARDTNLDRAYGNRSVLVNGMLLRRIRKVLQFGEKPFPTVSPRNSAGRAAEQDALWQRLNERASLLTSGPDELEGLASWVRGKGSMDSCGLLVQQVVGCLFAPEFQATPASWDAALVLDKAPRTMNFLLLAWWSFTKRVDRAKLLLAQMVDGNLAGLHATGIALHNIVKGMNRMRDLYSDQARRSSLSPEEAASLCLSAPAALIRQPTTAVKLAGAELDSATVVLLKLETANEKSPNADLSFLRKTWSRCPAEQWVPALLEGVWRRACQVRT
jgi:hypothetical protein